MDHKLAGELLEAMRSPEYRETQDPKVVWRYLAAKHPCHTEGEVADLLDKVWQCTFRDLKALTPIP